MGGRSLSAETRSMTQSVFLITILALGGNLSILHWIVCSTVLVITSEVIPKLCMLVILTVNMLSPEPLTRQTSGPETFKWVGKLHSKCEWNHLWAWSRDWVTEEWAEPQHISLSASWPQWDGISHLLLLPPWLLACEGLCLQTMTKTSPSSPRLRLLSLRWTDRRARVSFYNAFLDEKKNHLFLLFYLLRVPL